MRKTAGLVAAAAAIAVIGAVPASAGQSNVVRGEVYKGPYFSMGIEYPFRIKTFESGKSGNFSLKCAGIQRERIEIAKGKFQLRFGADEVQVKGRGRFKQNEEVKGEITKLITPGSTCSAGGSFEGAVVD